MSIFLKVSYGSSDFYHSLELYYAKLFSIGKESQESTLVFGKCENKCM